MTKLELLKQLRQLQQAEYAYIASLPADISTAVACNGYTDCLQRANSLLMEAAFGSSYGDAMWFMWEYSPDSACHIVEADGTEWCFGSDDEFYTYFEGLEGK